MSPTVPLKMNFDKVLTIRCVFEQQSTFYKNTIHWKFCKQYFLFKNSSVNTQLKNSEKCVSYTVADSSHTIPQDEQQLDPSEPYHTVPEDVSPRSLGVVDVVTITGVVPEEGLVHLQHQLALVADELQPARSAVHCHLQFLPEGKGTKEL